MSARSGHDGNRHQSFSGGSGRRAIRRSSSRSLKRRRWAHEYADTSRPVTAAFAGAPGLGFTVYGAAPQRDAATIGLGANTAIADSTSLYLRYDGELGTGTDNHVLSAGFRMSW